MAKWNKAPALFDSLGIATSWLCLVHCLGLPLLVLILPTLGARLHHDDKTHLLLAAWVFLFALMSLLSQKNKHKNQSVVCLMVTGLCLVLAATFSRCFGWTEAIEIPLITVGNLLVIAAHNLNRRHGCCQPKDTRQEASLDRRSIIAKSRQVVGSAKSLLKS